VVPLQSNSVIPPLSEAAQRVTLCPHPSAPAGNVERIEVGWEYRAPHALRLSYALDARADAIALPPARARQFADRLWEHTCFEAFLADPRGSYCELNFSPSTQWAAYRFTAYRADMAPVVLTRAPDISLRVDVQRIELDVDVDLAAFACVRQEHALRLALSAVIEERDGSRSYWALTHPGDKPDFHHPGSFLLRLPQDAEGVR
jgi:hypothetical protein